LFSRDTLIKSLTQERYDVAVIGGGATGLGTAIDAASRGYKTVLFEQADFAKGTSSRSTKLVHGGVRYLQQGNVKLVMDALRERGILRKNAAHLVKNQSFIVPNYKWWEGPFYGLGLKVYDWMSGSLGLGSSEIMSPSEVLKCAPTLDPTGLRGGVLYHDGQFDDARLAINLAQTAIEQGATALNYCSVLRFIKEKNKLTGLVVRDEIEGTEYEVAARVMINATGVFTDDIQRMDSPDHENTVSPSQGIHLVLDRTFLPGTAAIMIPHTDDGRVLFAVPWHNKVIVGTTDTPVNTIKLEPVPLEEEVEFLLTHARRYLTKNPTRADIKSIFAGLRPLIKGSAKKTADISRDHAINVSETGLISIIGGKWTTYRKMAEDAVHAAAVHASLPFKECTTAQLSIHGNMPTNDFETDDYYYGTDRQALEALTRSLEGGASSIHNDLPYTKAMIVWAVRNEMCLTVEDALCRRTRALLLDARAAMEAAPKVAGFMAEELKKDRSWIEEQVLTFNQLAGAYLPA
jgi:glycerol-3-phosphate dehydrogenase